MNLKGNCTRALKGFVYAGILGSRTLYLVGTTVMLGFVVIMTLMNAAFLSSYSNSNSNGGALIDGFLTVAICMIVFAIISAGRKTMRSNFVFPINKLVYHTGTLIVFGINTMVLLLAAALCYVIESAVFRIMEATTRQFVYLTFLTPSSFLVGLLVSWAYIMALATLTYFVFAQFTRYRLAGIAGFGLVAGALFFSSQGRHILGNVLAFYTGEGSVPLVVIKLTLTCVLLFALSSVQLKNLEVYAQ